jgi:hypothetical protein
MREAQMLFGNDKWKSGVRGWYKRNYLNNIAPTSLVGRRLLERDIYDDAVNEIMRLHADAMKQKAAEIERLNDVIKVKDAYIDMYSRPQKPF